MKRLTFSTADTEPEANDKSVWAHFYRKHDFKNIFESYTAWGPTSMEIHCVLTPKKKKLIVKSMYYTQFGGADLDEKRKAPRDQLETLCTVFKLPIKPIRKGK